MELVIDDIHYDIKINRKIGVKNIYIRVNDDLEIVVSTGKLTSNNTVEKVINDNISSIKKMIKKVNDKRIYNSKFFYLGKEYDVIYTNSNSLEFGDNKVFMDKKIDVDYELKKIATPLFRERLDYIYSIFSCTIPYPSLTVRKMKSRWGVCNTKTKRVTLNLELIKKDISCLDYVIVHELSHLVHADHSKAFWNLVEKNYPEYKKVRKQMKEY